LDQTFFALIDSGSNSTLRLNPVGLTLKYAQAPRLGAIVSSLTGDRQQTVARLDQTVAIGDQQLDKPIVEITDELPALGGGVLKNFTVTFDQEKSHVVFHREKRQPVSFPPKRSPGMSVTKAGAYWRIVGVVPGSPAAKAGIEDGDLITRINQESVEQWGSERFNALVEQSDSIVFSFLIGKREYEMKLGIMELVP
ncbi:MAG: PDZ domain-containing protein, partial [Opitutaceae bacterium]